MYARVGVLHAECILRPIWNLKTVLTEIKNGNGSYELQSELLEGGDIGEYYRGHSGEYSEFRLWLIWPLVS